MSEKLNSSNFIEILNKNDLKNKFNLPKNYNMDQLATKTLDFIKNTSDENNSPLTSLATLLKSNAIPVQSYFNFLGTINEIDFDNKEYREFLSERYTELFKQIDETSISDLDKLNSKIKLLEQSEKSIGINETKRAIVKTAVTVTAVIGGTAIALKSLETSKQIAVAAASASKVKNVCNTIITVVTLPLKIFK